MQYIRQKNYRQPIFIKELNEDFFTEAGNSPIIILDDAAYSGAQLSNLLNSIYLKLVKKDKQPPNIYILLIALNDNSKFKLSNIQDESLKYIPSPFKLIYLEERCYKPIISKIGIEKYFYMLLLFSPWTITNNVPYVSMYLDHKMADENSTFTTTLLYGQIPPSKIDIEIFYGNTQFSSRDIGVFDINEKNRLISGLDTRFLNKNKVDYYELLENFKNLDVSDKSQDELTFKPFIKGCNENPILLENIGKSEIRNLDYFIFMLPGNCFDLNANEDCVLETPSSQLIYYLEVKGMYNEDETDINPITKKRIVIKKAEFTEEGEKLIPIHKQISDVKCPVSWYKKGDYQMSCENTAGGKKKSRRQIKKTRKTRKTKKTRITRKNKK